MPFAGFEVVTGNGWSQILLLGGLRGGKKLTSFVLLLRREKVGMVPGMVSQEVLLGGGKSLGAPNAVLREGKRHFEGAQNVLLEHGGILVDVCKCERAQVEQPARAHFS